MVVETLLRGLRNFEHPAWPVPAVAKPFSFPWGTLGRRFLRPLSAKRDPGSINSAGASGAAAAKMGKVRLAACEPPWHAASLAHVNCFTLRADAGVVRFGGKHPVDVANIFCPSERPRLRAARASSLLTRFSGFAQKRLRGASCPRASQPSRLAPCFESVAIPRNVFGQAVTGTELDVAVWFGSPTRTRVASRPAASRPCYGRPTKPPIGVFSPKPPTAYGLLGGDHRGLGTFF